MINRAILNVAFPFARISESTAGGAEQVLHFLDKKISRSGNRSIVLASKGSKVNGLLYEFEEDIDLINEAKREEIYKKYQSEIEDILSDQNIDLIHFHGLDFRQYLPPTSIPVLVTLHLPVPWYRPDCFSIEGINFNFVSRFQFLKYGKKINVPFFIENGVNIPEKMPERKRGAYTLSMGRICPEKGYHLAIEASKRVNLPYILAGKVYPYEDHIKYFRNYIKPAIHNQTCEFIGEIDSKQKEKLFRRAVCLLVPSLVEETSSLVAMEAMAFGVPVIAFKAGALIDIIKEGKNGYLVNNEIEMAQAISDAEKIYPIECYNMAINNYSVDRMTRQYLELYEKLINC
ncbi:MAG TPA: glycosyltransferase [Chitinispirillaceae bacterium]|nr:glycosyltransferase [Chitinispirillaceae bacterium]